MVHTNSKTTAYEPMRMNVTSEFSIFGSMNETVVFVSYEYIEFSVFAITIGVWYYCFNYSFRILMRLCR